MIPGPDLHWEGQIHAILMIDIFGSINHLVFFNKRLRIKFGYNFSIWHFVKICHDSRDIDNNCYQGLLLFMSLKTGKGKRKYYSTLFYIMEIFNWKQIISKHKLFFFLKGGQFLCHYTRRYLCFLHVTLVHEINVLNYSDKFSLNYNEE